MKKVVGLISLWAVAMNSLAGDWPQFCALSYFIVKGTIPMTICITEPQAELGEQSEPHSRCYMT